MAGWGIEGIEGIEGIGLGSVWGVNGTKRFRMTACQEEESRVED